MDGAPLEPPASSTGRRTAAVSIFSIAHLGDAERMFFVSLLLNQIVGWMRTQTGTSSLRALVYMDEIAGYFPPVANPPSKPPLLTLLKQGRAFGLGVLLATQNPVDLDYKGLANTGTWFLGRLQTDRDKQRVLDGLEGAAGNALDRAETDRLLSALGKRVFLLHNVHDPRPGRLSDPMDDVVSARPLDRDQILALRATRPAEGGGGAARPPTSLPARAARQTSRLGSAARVSCLAARARHRCCRQGAAIFPTVPGVSRKRAAGTLLPGRARRGPNRVRRRKARSRRDARRALLRRNSPTPLFPVDWASATRLEVPVSALRKDPGVGATYAPCTPPPP